MTWMPDIDQIRLAHERILPMIHVTPVMTSQSTNERLGAEVFFKCENFQKIGAFKMRGAAHAVSSLTPEQLKNGVATHSSGNHAQALSRAALLAGTKAYIVMPESAPKVKVEAVKNYGGNITFCEPNLKARETTLDEVVAKTGATFIHPYDNQQVITGQATAALELFDEVDDLDILIVPVGGGGLMSGSIATAKGLGKKTKIIAVEPAGADDAYRSFKSGKFIPMENPDTIADGLLTSMGKLTYPIIKENISDVWTVTDEEIIEALRWTYERMKIIIEPSCAVPLACMFKNRDYIRGKKVGTILTGGNIDLEKLKSLI